jgi:hypothetical protein
MGTSESKGAANKVTREVREVATELVESPQYRAHLERRLISGQIAPAIEVMLWHFAYGRLLGRFVQPADAAAAARHVLAIALNGTLVATTRLAERH